MTIRLATCACGQLQAQCASDPDLVSLCHCKACQRRTGSAFGIAAFFARAAVETSGEQRSFTRSSDSGYAVTFHFCPACGSTVHRPGMLAVAVGAFADSSFPAPVREVYTDERCRWLGLQVPAQPQS